MARRVSIPISFGRGDRVDPKLAPMGVMAVAKNLRVRKDGRLGCRHGFRALDMSDASGDTMVAYDLHEFSNGRLCAFGASQGEGFPVDIYEYRGLPAATPWRCTDQEGNRPVLTPFTEPREVGGAPLPADGMRAADCAAGLGYVCTVWKPEGSTFARMQVVRESDNQVQFAGSLESFGWTRARVCFAAGRFYLVGFDAANNDLELGSFVPGSSASVTSLATIEGSASSSFTFELEAVGNPTNSAVIVVYGDASSATATVSVKRYNSAGTQQGTTLTLASQARPLNLAIEADEADDTVNLLVSQHDGSGEATDVDLRTYNFSNSLLDGPTACNTGYRATLCRVGGHVAVVSSAIDASGNLVVEWFDQDTHALAQTTTIGNAMLATAMVPAGATGQALGVVVGGFVAAEFDVETNALWYVSPTMVHMTTRDLRNSARNATDFYAPLGLSKDTSTGRVAWQSLYFAGSPGSDVENYTVTTFALQSSARRQAASAGGLLYIAGAPLQLYDGHSCTEAGFNEVPGIKSVTADTGGSLEENASYEYVMVWEYALPDGTFYESPPSPPVVFTTGAGEDEANVTVFGPHSARVALGDAVYGAQVTGVLYRTVWDSVNGARFSEFKEAQRFEVPSSLAAYGDDIVVSDTRSDTALARRPTLYTQGGPVEHNAAEACTYVSASSARLSVAGLARQSEAQESKEQELDEAVNFSNLSSFFTRAPNPIVGILSLDGIRILFTRPDIFTVAGEGPQNDASGALPQPVELASPGGLKDARSLLKAPDGVWFQLDDNKLYRMPRGNGAPEWLGVDIQDTLASFPVITGACRARADDCLVWSCENTGGTDGRLIVRSLRTGIWTEDTVPLGSGAGIEAVSSFGDLVAYISGGVVYAQSESGFTDGAASAITTQWKTHPLFPFELGGNGQVEELMATGEFRSSGTLALRVSYDAGLTWVTMDSFELSGLDSGALVRRKWALGQSDAQSLVAEITFTPATPGEGFILNQLDILVEPANGLPDLDPEEMA
jgi:hypothetical protein